MKCRPSRKTMIEDKELRDLYNVESQERLQHLEAGFLRLEREPANPAVLGELFREAHSLKGASKMVNEKDVEMLAHHMEDILGKAFGGEAAISSETVDRLCGGLDAMRKLVAEAVTGAPSGVDYIAAMEQLTGKAPAGVFQKPEGESVPPVSPPVPAEGKKPEAETGKVVSGPQPQAGPAPFRIETVRVSTHRLDTLMTSSGELAVTRTRFDRRLTEIEEILSLWEEWSRQRIFNHAPPLQRGRNGKDPSKKAVGPAFPENGNWERVGPLLERFRHELYEDGAKLDRVAGEIEEGVRAIRLLPLSTIFDLFPRMVRDLAREQGKKVRLLVKGGEALADKRVLEEMKDPLMHVLRNSIDHGIETPERRESSGKPPEGTITLQAWQTGPDIAIEVGDDGAGLDLENIKRAALKRGLRQREELDRMSPQQIHSLILTPGFSTSSFVTEISGRGVGLDAVRARVESLNGTIQLESAAGAGFTIRIRLPVTLATTRILLTRAEGKIYGFPVDSVKTMRWVAPDEIFRIEGHETVAHEGAPLSVAPLAELLSLEGKRAGPLESKPGSRFPCIVLGAGEGGLGVFVDDLLDEQEVVLKPHCALLRRVPNVSGLTILGTGDICTVLNPRDLIATLQKKRVSAGPVPAGKETEGKRGVLLVEDSILTRALEKRIIEDGGYEVETAVDGVDALNKLASRRFDAVVSDILMPNMDGLALTQKIRQDPKYRELPVVLVTSLASDKDKKRGMEAGANAYIPKPAFDQKLLLDTLRRLI